MAFLSQSDCQMRLSETGLWFSDWTWKLDFPNYLSGWFCVLSFLSFSILPSCLGPVLRCNRGRVLTRPPCVGTCHCDQSLGKEMITMVTWLSDVWWRCSCLIVITWYWMVLQYMVSWYYMVLHGIITVHLLRSRDTNITNVAHTKKTKRPAVESASTLSLNHALGWHLDNHNSQHWFNKNRFPYTELVVALNSPTQRTARISAPATSKKLGLRGRGRPTPLASSRSRGSQCARHHVAEWIELHRVCKIKATTNRHEGWIPKLM